MNKDNSFNTERNSNKLNQKEIDKDYNSSIFDIINDGSKKEEFSITETIWLELRNLNLIINSMSNCTFYISISPSLSLVLEFKNLNRNTRCVEKMRIEIKERYIKINFNIVVNFEDFIIEDYEDTNFCIIEKKSSKALENIINKVKNIISVTDSFKWSIKMLSELDNII